MTFIEQIQANNNPNSPDRIKARELLASMESKKPATVKETKTVIGNNGLGNVYSVIDSNGENWIQFTR